MPAVLPKSTGTSYRLFPPQLHSIGLHWFQQGLPVGCSRPSCIPTGLHWSIAFACVSWWRLAEPGDQVVCQYCPSYAFCSSAHRTAHLAQGIRHRSAVDVCFGFGRGKVSRVSLVFHGLCHHFGFIDGLANISRSGSPPGRLCPATSRGGVQQH